MNKPIFKPGEDNQRPGTYREVGPRGGEVSNPRTVRIDRGDRLPPTQEPGRRWVKEKPKCLCLGLCTRHFSLHIQMRHDGKTKKKNQYYR